MVKSNVPRKGEWKVGVWNTVSHYLYDTELGQDFQSACGAPWYQSDGFCARSGKPREVPKCKRCLKALAARVAKDGHKYEVAP